MLPRVILYKLITQLIYYIDEIIRLLDQKLYNDKNQLTTYKILSNVIISLYTSMTRKRTYKKNIFQCNHCPRSFSRQGAFRNHLRSHRDQMYLDENNLTREENTKTSEQRSISTHQRTVLSPISINETVNLYNEQALELNVWKVEFFY